jgi:hypothetical protein
LRGPRAARRGDAARADGQRARRLGRGRRPRGRRFSIHVDARLEDGASEADAATAREAATLLLGLPWELAHDGTSFVFQGARPTRVRRRLPNTRQLDVAVVATPIRILVISARPEDDVCGIDHGASALPIAAGSRDRRLADAPGLHYSSAAELLHLLDQLDDHERGRSER